jgi:hypothetical protein
LYGLEFGETRKRPVLGIGDSAQNQEKTCSFTCTASPSETIFPWRCPNPKIALIREKTALMFWDIRGIKPVWQSGVFSQQKMTANSTYREAKLNSDDLEVAEWGKRDI